MSLITQGKTNWKLLLIVVILAAAVGGGIFWYSTKQKVSPIQPSKFKQLEQVTLNYKSTLSQMFSEKEFSEVQERKDCFQDKEKIFYCVEDIKEDFLTEPNKKNNLIVIREGTYLEQGGQPSYPHAAGIYHAWLAVFEAQTNKILTSPLKLGGDSGEINFYNCKNKTFISFTWTVGGQGLFYGGIQLLDFENNNLREIWSWKSDNGILLRQEGDKIAVYQMQAIPPDFECTDKCLYDFGEWAYLHSYDFKWDDGICGFRKDEAADWQTYRNEEYGFEIKYPSDQDSYGMDVRNDEAGLGEGIKLLIDWIPYYMSNSLIRLMVFSNPNNYTVQSNPDTFFAASPDCKNVEINGLIFCEVSGVGVTGTGTDVPYFQYYISRNGYMYSVNLDLGLGEEEILVEFNQMLSTFRFLE